jgi:hypothetical protein
VCHSQRRGFTNTNAYTDCYTNRCSDSYGYSYSDGDANTNAYGYGNSDLNADSTCGEAITDAQATSNNTAATELTGKADSR